MSLTPQQIRENIAALKSQGAPKEVVDAYLKQAYDKPDLGIDSETFTNKGIGGKAARFLGIEKIGNFVGSNLAKLDPQHRANLATIKQEDPEAARILSRGGDVTNRELVGSAANLVGNAVLPFAGKALNTGKLGTRIAKGAGLGAGFGAAGGLESGQDNAGVLLSTILGSAVGGTIPAVGAGLKSVAKNFGPAVLPEKLYNVMFKNTSDDVFGQLRTTGIADIQKTDPELFKKAIKAGIVHLGKDGVYKIDETIAKQALDRNLRGSLETMAKSVVHTNVKSEVGVRDIVKNYKPKISVDNKKGLLNVLIGIKSDFAGQYNEVADKKVINAMIKQVKTGKVDATTLLDMRRLLDKQRVASTYKTVPGKINISQESYKAASNSLRSKLNSIKGVEKIMDDYAFSIEALEHIAKEATKRGNASALSLIDSILIGSGVAGGNPIAAGGLAASRKILGLPSVLTGLGQGINTLGRATAPIRSLTGKTVQASKPLARTAMYNTIGGTGKMLGN